jgi:tetratricopeptide (TPR) repeat protein
MSRLPRFLSSPALCAVLMAMLGLLGHPSGALAGPDAAPAPQGGDAMARGWQRMEQRDYAGAAEEFTRAILGGRNNDSSRTEAYVGRGNARLELGDLQGAVDDFSRGLVFSHNAEAYIGRGNARARLGDMAGAMGDWDRALQYATSYLTRASVYSSRSEARSRAGDAAGALADLEEALRLRPDSADL